MQVCNISFQLNPTIQSSWLLWMKTTFIGELMATGCFNDHKFYQLEVPEDQNPTFTLQLYADNKAQLNRYHTQFADTLILQLNNKWGEQCLYFSTNMQIVN